jgi:predicted DNA-binding transcriptional regulator AlpA
MDPQSSQPKTRRIVRPREFSDRLFGPGKSLSSLYDRIAKGDIEPGKKILGTTSVGWDSEYVDSIIEKILGPSPDNWQSLGEAAERVIEKAKP